MIERIKNLETQATSYKLQATSYKLQATAKPHLLPVNLTGRYLMHYPPPPWRLEGSALLRLQALPISRVRHAIPPELSVVSVAPGRTLGGMFFAHYGAGSTRAYHELIVVPGLVRRGARIGAWVSHIYVDDLQSLAAGRDMWGLPKAYAKFAWEPTADGVDVVVSDEDKTLCSLSATGAKKRLPLPLYAPVLAQRQGQLVSFAGKGRGRIASANGDLYVPGSSPFSLFGLSEGRLLQIDHFKLKLPEPELLGAL